VLLLQGLGDQGFGVLDEYGALSGVGEVGEGACAAATLSTGDECRGRPLASTSGGGIIRPPGGGGGAPCATWPAAARLDSGISRFWTWTARTSPSGSSKLRRAEGS
jgi:hypothetical protein